MSFSTVYLTNRTAPYSPATIRGAWDASANAVTKALDPQKTGGGLNANVAVAEASATAEYDVLLYRGVSGPLAAQTISGTVNACIGIKESAAAADVNWHVHIFVTQGDSDSVRGTLVSDYRESAGTNEWPTTATFKGLNTATALTDLAVSAGDRLVVEIGYSARNTSTTSYTGTLYYGTQQADYREMDDGAAAGTDVTTKAPFLTFSTEIAEATIADRVTRAAVRTLSGDTSAAVRATRVVVRTLSPIGSPIAVTRAAVRTLSGDTSAAVRATRTVVRALSRQIPPDPCAAPEGGEDLGAASVDTIRLWSELDLGDGTVIASAEEELDDDPTYHEGWKPPTLANVGAIERALASLEGDIETGRGSITLNDDDLALRAAFVAGGKAFPKGSLAIYAASDAARKALLAPMLLAYGVPAENPDFDGLRTTIRYRDWVGAARALGLNGDAQIPKRVFSARDFPDAPAELLDGNHGVPIPLGIVTPPPAVTAPTLALVAGGSLIVGKTYYLCVEPVIAGVESWASAPVFTSLQPAMLTLDSSLGKPTGHATSHIEGGGTLSRYYWTRMTAVTADGHESPVSNLGDCHGDGTIGAKLTAGASSSGTVTKYRGYLFNAKNASGIFNPSTNYTALVPNVAGDPVVVRYKEIDAADLADGIEFLSDSDGADYLASGGQSIEETLTAVDGATAYNVYLADSPTEASFVRTQQVTGLTVTWTSETDGSDAGLTALPAPAPDTFGWIEGIYAGTEVIGGVTHYRAVFAGHAFASIDHWRYQDGESAAEVDAGEGTYIRVPGHSGWETYFTTPYRDLLGTDGVTRRYTILYLFGAKGAAFAAGTATVRVQAHTLEDVGDGTGETITDRHDQDVAVLNLFILADYQSGTWPTPPMRPGSSVCQVCRTSFTLLKALRQSQVSGGYSSFGTIGAGGTRKSTTQVLKDMQQSSGYQLGPNWAWQIAASALDEDDSPATYPELNDELHWQKESIKPYPKLEELANEIPYTFGVCADGASAGSGTRRDTTSIAAYGTCPGTARSMPLVSSPPVARHILNQVILQTKDMPWYVEVEGGMELGAYDLGAGIRVQHFKGVGTAVTSRPYRIVRKKMLPSPRRYRITARDVTDALA